MAFIEEAGTINPFTTQSQPLQGFPGGSDGKASVCNAGDRCSTNGDQIHDGLSPSSLHQFLL